MEYGPGTSPRERVDALRAFERWSQKRLHQEAADVLGREEPVDVEELSDEDLVRLIAAWEPVYAGGRMGCEPKAWENYEEVAVHLLNRLADHLGLDQVEGKQKVEGESGTSWEIDGKGVQVGDEGFVVLECRRYPSSRVTQEEVGGLAFRISDTGAQGGIIVTPIGLQEGAKKVAAHAGVEEVRLDANSTDEDYVLSFLNRVFAGVSDTMEFGDEVDFVVPGPDGEVSDDG